MHSSALVLTLIIFWIFNASIYFSAEEVNYFAELGCLLWLLKVAGVLVEDE